MNGDAMTRLSSIASPALVWLEMAPAYVPHAPVSQRREYESWFPVRHVACVHQLIRSAARRGTRPPSASCTFLGRSAGSHVMEGQARGQTALLIRTRSRSVRTTAARINDPSRPQRSGSSAAETVCVSQTEHMAGAPMCIRISDCGRAQPRWPLSGVSCMCAPASSCTSCCACPPRLRLLSAAR